MTETDQIVDEIDSGLSSLARRSEAISDSDLDEQISTHLPEPSAPDPQPSRASTSMVHSVAVQGVRSFGPEQTLHLSEGLTIVYADNGKGKTSLTDAFELVTDGATSRKVGLPNAASEVHDKDHIAHRTLTGAPDLSYPPRVRVSFHDGSSLQECEWNSFNSPAPHHPDLQVLPRRLLRQTVNAKRTERIEPLGAALGLAEISASWTAISKELGARSAAASEGGAAYLQLLSKEVTLEDDDKAQLAALGGWAQEQSLRVDTLPDPPAAEPWHQLARNLDEAASSQVDDSELTSDLTTLLTAFVNVAEPGSVCPACDQAPVPAARLAEVNALLDRSRTAADQAALRAGLNSHRDAIAASVAAWLQIANSPDQRSTRYPSTWIETLDRLQKVFDQRHLLTEEQWARDLAVALDCAGTVRAQIVHSSQEDSSPDRQRAVDAVTADATETLEALREFTFRRAVLAPLLKRAQSRTKALLLSRVEEEFAGLENPINDWLKILGPEGTPRISLKPVATTARPSLDLRVATHSGGVPGPHVTGYFSDAQLDMLGMAVHLARIERDHPGSTIVIDDPSDMLDSTSREALSRDGFKRLLEDGEFPAHQVVVLTHDDQLVRALWDAHRNRRPPIVQDTIEIHLSDDKENAFSTLTSRTAAHAVARAVALMDDHWGAHQDRLWFRAALASHTRQAAEMCAKDVDTLLGPAGLALHPQHRQPNESGDLGAVGIQIRATLRETTANWCHSGRHKVAREKLGELGDQFSQHTADLLNPGAHADVVLPEASASRKTLEKLNKVVTLLCAPEGRPRSSWTTQSELADLLRSGQDCPTCGS